MKPSHFFISESSGDLHDTRSPDWAAKPLRIQYQRTYSEISSGRELRATLRNGEFAWPGGYPLYFVTSDGAALSFSTVRDNLRSVIDSIRSNSRDGWRVIGCQVNWEDSELYDDHTSVRIPSAYAED